MIKKVNKPLEYWKKKLTPEVFEITRAGGTEPAFKNEYWNKHDEGLYKCSNCNLTLFSSKDKFDSGTGWPSFTKPYRKDRIDFNLDRSLGMIRQEAKCARCAAHLGHVFDDGPKPTGLRFCMNSAALDFVKAK